ncbi:aldehyde dehydrogenase EutE [Clostridium sp. SYSU_GA19001]|uniref:aldehyde dehydrogenase family protein n=1 Tax=Clostridium caldaquaticum TaxID=2940653 RepID=UPI002077218B|nr:aldehyde dehydrogenase family protein [Clostridium caldaquaticum]MCM8710027.1 aldehyde dehydrogenase EutE [Clostridium caldaquaticum]
MAIKEEQLQEIVKQVLLNLKVAAPEEVKNSTSISELGVFEDIHAAIKAAKEAQKKLKAMPMEFREKIIQNIRKKTIENAKALAELGVSETGMGRVEHKILKHELVANKTPGTEDIKTTAWSGDKGLTLVEMGPFGVIGAITPSTNPSETVICNSMGMIAGGNTVVFNPHPGAIKVSCMAVQLVNEASLEAGGPENLAVTVRKPTLETADVLFSHPDIALLAVTGGPGVVTAALSSGKRAIGAGAGNPPVIVDETADIKKAAKDIIDGATFDNNLPCIAEKEVIAVDKIADELIYYMIQNGCYKIEGEEIERLANLVLVNKNGKITLNRKWVGKDASKILKGIGIEADDSIRCIIFEADKSHILVQEELMMPILGIVRANDVDEAIEFAKELEHGNRHSAHMHSKNIDNLTKFAREIDTAIFVKNAPSYAALGFGGEGYCTFTIASRTGEGLTSAKSFTKARRCVLSDGLSIR